MFGIKYNGNTTPPYNHNGFTLSEILITLVIIGIVAALTVPVMIQKMRRDEVETKLKRIYSVMNQAINMSKMDNGPFESWDYSVLDGTYDGAKNFYDKHFDKYLKVMKVEQEEGSDYLRLYFLDGSVLRIKPNFRDIFYYIKTRDIDHEIRGKNMFVFRFAPVFQMGSSTSDNEQNYNKYHYNKGFESYAYHWNGEIENAKNHTSNGCYSGSNHIYCARLIQANGWKIPDDYPWL